jgi:hypothetical protein
MGRGRGVWEEGRRRVKARTPNPLKKATEPGAGWLKCVILATQEAEIRRITVQSQPRQIDDTLSQNISSQKRAGGLGPEFKYQYWKKKMQWSMLEALLKW